MTSSWFFLSTLNYDARSNTHQIYCTSCFPTATRTCILVRICDGNARDAVKNTGGVFYLRIPPKDEFPRAHHTISKACSLPSVACAVPNGTRYWREHTREQTVHRLTAISEATWKHRCMKQEMVLEQLRFSYFCSDKAHM